MKNTLLLLFVIVFSFKMKAQIVEASTTIPTNEYLDLLAANLEIPEEISKKYQNSSIDITIILTITKDGSVFNPKIQNDSLQLESNLKKAVEKLPKWNPKTEDGIEPSLNREVVRVIKSMPKWKPATENGVPVRSDFKLPIKIKINQ